MTKYKVTAATGFRGHHLDDEFEAELTPDEERRAKDRGSIRVLSRDAKPKKNKEEGTDDA